MHTSPASDSQSAPFSPSQLIALFLARLSAYLLRLERAQAAGIPSDANGAAYVAHAIKSAEGLVQAYLRQRAAQTLGAAGFTEIAHAMRGPTASCLPQCTPTPDQTDQTKPLSALRDHLDHIQSAFEHADQLAECLARLIICALTMLNTSTGSARLIVPHPRSMAVLPGTQEKQNCRFAICPPWPPPRDVHGHTLAF